MPGSSTEERSHILTGQQWLIATVVLQSK